MSSLMLVLACATAAFAEEGAKVTYISDLRLCTPTTALSHQLEQGKWQVIRYTTDEVSGTMIGAASFIDAPDVTLRLEATGWHAVYLGYWNPYFAYDGGTVVKAKLSGDAAFRRIREPNRCMSQEHTALQEVFLDHADLTGQNLVIGKMKGAMGQKAYVAYAKLVPLSPEEVQAVQADRARADTRRLVATIDGMSYFHHSECVTADHVRELVEPYRHSDVGKVLWAVNYGDRTNYPSEVGTFTAGDATRASLVDIGTNAYIIGEKTMHESLRRMADQGIIPEQVAAEHAHSMGLKFDLMFRLGILGHLPPVRGPMSGRLLADNPQFRQVLRDGTVVEKASYAFPGVREFMLSLIREATTKFDADGINLCFVRGPRFLSYEQPVLDAFRAKYDVDARQVDSTDPRLQVVWADLMTQFVRGAREVLDQVGKAKGKRLELSAWVWPSDQNVWCGRTLKEEGLDVPGWIRDGLLNSVVFQEGINADDLALCQKHDCEFVLFTGYRGDKAMSPKSISAAYAAGVDRFAYWDIDCAQDSPATWEWLRRVGHREEMENWSEREPSSRRIRLRTLDGLGVSKALQQAVYSGG